MKKIIRFLLFGFLLAGITFSCKKSDKNENTTVVPKPGEWIGSIVVYSSRNDTTLQKFLDGNYTRITGNLELYTSEAIDYRKYLINLKTIYGSLKLYKVPNGDLNFISSVTRITGDMQISYCPNIVDLTGIDQLDTINGSLILENNPKLLSCHGMEGLPSLINITVNGNSSMQSLTGLENVSTVSGKLTVLSNPQLTSLQGLNGIETITGGLDIYGNPLLSNLNGLTSLKSLPGILSLTNLPELTSLAGLSQLKDTVNSIYITKCDKLPDLSGLNSLGAISNDLRLINCSGMKNLQGLAKIDTIGGTAELNGLSGLVFFFWCKCIKSNQKGLTDI